MAPARHPRPPPATKGAIRRPQGDNAEMALRLFRTTGYSTLLMPGESRVAPHPVRLVVWGSLWLALACNVAVWRVLAGSAEDWRSALASVLVIAGASGIVFSLLGWRRTLKPALTLALIAGALFAAGSWSQQLPVESLWQRPPRTWLPAWASFMRWRVLLLVAVLAVVPIVAVWNTSVRRISGQAQLRSTLWGLGLGAVVLAAGLFFPG